MSKRAVKGLDHVVVMVDGIDAAQRAYERLGFQVQPRGFHKKLGTANHLMIFDTDYFEILGIVEPTPFNAERRDWLKDGGGLANVALATDGADIAFEAFKAAGLNPDAPLAFDRAVEVLGKAEHAQFRTVRIPKTNMPVVGFFVCEHLTPQLVYHAEWAKHPNGARGIRGSVAGFFHLSGRPNRCYRFRFWRGHCRGFQLQCLCGGRDVLHRFSDGQCFPKQARHFARLQ
jgi:catechol 2,3-dioxygenase-like lactoylglutathione lyase family enzyme